MTDEQIGFGKRFTFTLSGTVGFGDGYRCGGENMKGVPLPDGAVLIGEVDIIYLLHDHKGGSIVMSVHAAGLADANFDGRLRVELGWGYSEYTPMEEDVFFIDDENMIEFFEAYRDREVTIDIMGEETTSVLPQ